LSVVGSIIGASDPVKDVFAEASSVGASRVASLDTERVAADEVVPLDDLLVIVAATRECGGVEETAKGVTTKVGTMGVELSSIVIGLEVNESLINEADNLDVVWGPHKLDTLEGSSGDEATAMTGLSAPGNFLMLRLANGGGTVRGSPETEVIDRVHDGSLAEGLLVLGRRVTPVETRLRATDTNVWVGLVWKVVVVEMLRSQGSDGRSRGGRSVLGIHLGRNDGDGHEG
jgi:hypothetical protein